MKGFLLQSFFLVCVVSAVKGDCYRGPIHESWRSGRKERYCLTREVKPEVVLYGQTLDTQDCYRCSCDHNGLSCCGFGIKAGSFASHVPVPDGCMLVVDGCNYYYVHTATLEECYISGK